MNVVGYDPVLSVDAALALPGDRMVRVTDLNDLFKVSDYISIHVPYIKGVTHHLIDAKALQICKPDVCILNFARGEIVDGEAMKAGYDSKKSRFVIKPDINEFLEALHTDRRPLRFQFDRDRPFGRLQGGGVALGGARR